MPDEKSGTMLFKALKTGFVENKGQSDPLSVKILAISHFSLNLIQTLNKLSNLVELSHSIL